MKNLLILIALSTFFWVSCTKKQNSIQGVWQYVEDDQLNKINGMSFFTKDNFAFVVNYEGKNSDSSQKSLAYSGTYILEDTLVTATILHAQNPQLIGRKLRWIHRSNGNDASYEVLDKNGKVVQKGKVKRLE